LSRHEEDATGFDQMAQHARRQLSLGTRSDDQQWMLCRFDSRDGRMDRFQFGRQAANETDLQRQPVGFSAAMSSGNSRPDGSGTRYVSQTKGFPQS